MKEMKIGLNISEQNSRKSHWTMGSILPYLPNHKALFTLYFQRTIGGHIIYVNKGKCIKKGLLYSDIHSNTVKPLFIVFIGGLKKKQWIWENNRCGSHS
jgi:hypothetical protein